MGLETTEKSSGKGSTGGNEKKVEAKMYSEKDMMEMVDRAVGVALSKQQVQVQPQSFDPNVLAEAIVNATKSKSGEAPKQFNSYAYLSKDDISEADLLDEPKTYWSTGIMNVVTDDIKKGIITPAPYGPVKFVAVGMMKRMTGKDTHILIYSEYQSWSQKECTWIEEHTLFGIEFYESLGEITNDDFRKNKLISKYHTALLNVPAPHIIQQIKDVGLIPTTNVPQMRLELAHDRATKELDRYVDAQKLSVSEGNKEKLLLEKN